MWELGVSERWLWWLLFPLAWMNWDQAETHFSPQPLVEKDSGLQVMTAAVKALGEN